MTCCKLLNPVSLYSAEHCFSHVVYMCARGFSCFPPGLLLSAPVSAHSWRELQLYDCSQTFCFALHNTNERQRSAAFAVERSEQQKGILSAFLANMCNGVGKRTNGIGYFHFIYKAKATLGFCVSYFMIYFLISQFWLSAQINLISVKAFSLPEEGSWIQLYHWRIVR